MSFMRISKFLSASGVTSRRKGEKLILSGRVKVNDKTITDLAFKIDPTMDTLKLDNNIINLNNKKIYIKLFKPKGYITSLHDELGRKTIFELIDIKERIYPVGRLDKDSRGLLLLTNDGDFAYKLTHPKFEVQKLYKIYTKGIPSTSDIKILENGIECKDIKTCPCKIHILKRYKNSCCLLIKIHEGKKREIRIMFDHIGKPVEDLLRLKVGPIGLDHLREGEWRYLNKTELNKIDNSRKI